MTSSQFESWGLPGPGRWVTIYATTSHVYMYVAGLRWDTHNAAGPGDGSSGIGWHPLVRSDSGFVVRIHRGFERALTRPIPSTRSVRPVHLHDLQALPTAPA